MEGAGLFRRVVVTHKTVAYEIWQAAAGGKVKHMKFSLIPPGSTPTESDRYQVKSSGKACGTVSLHFYRDNGKVYREFLVFSYGGLEQALSSGGRPLTPVDFEDDRREVAALERTAAAPNFYGTLDGLALTHIQQDVPRCA